jgi:hypothetical protein
MISRIIILILVLLFPVSGFCNDKMLPKWKASCNCNGVTFDLSFSSLSGDPNEDDMIISLIPSDGKKIQIPVQQALYSKRSVVSDEKNICDNIVGFKIRDDRILLWLSRNDRPQWDQLSLVLIDPRKLKVIDVKEDVGPIKDACGTQRMAIRKKNNGYEIRLERDWLKNTGTDSADNSIEDWMYIQVINDKISNKWTR